MTRIDPVLERELRYWTEIFAHMPNPQLGPRLAATFIELLIECALRDVDVQAGHHVLRMRGRPDD